MPRRILKSSRPPSSPTRVFYEEFKNGPLHPGVTPPRSPSGNSFLADLTEPAPPITTAAQHRRQRNPQHPTPRPIASISSTAASTRPPPPIPPIQHLHLTPPTSHRNRNSRRKPLGRVNTHPGLSSPSSGARQRPGRHNGAKLLYRIEFTSASPTPSPVSSHASRRPPRHLSKRGANPPASSSPSSSSSSTTSSRWSAELRPVRQTLPFLGVWDHLLFAAAGAILLYQMSAAASPSASSPPSGRPQQARHPPHQPQRIANTRSNYESPPSSNFRSISRMQFLSCSTTTSCASTRQLLHRPLLLSPDSSSSSLSSNSSAHLPQPHALITSRIPHNSSPTSLQVPPLRSGRVSSLRSTQPHLELTAMKTSGISLPHHHPRPLRHVLISAGLFAFDESISLATPQEALSPSSRTSRPDLSRRPPVDLRPDKQRRRARRIFYYSASTPNNKFANSRLRVRPRRLHLQRDLRHLRRWDRRSTPGLRQRLAALLRRRGHRPGGYKPFTVALPRDQGEPTTSRRSTSLAEMSYNELSAYIADLKQSGFETKRLSVQLNKKIAYPLITSSCQAMAVAMP